MDEQLQTNDKVLSNRGGYRPGAGRPKGTFKPDKKKPFTFKLSVEEEKAVRELLAKMRNKLLLLLAVFVFGMSVSAMTLTGGVSYSEETARLEAFKDVYFNLPSFTNQPEYTFNLYAANDIKSVQKIKALIWTFYCVEYTNKPNYIYCYEKKKTGNSLVAVEIVQGNPNKFPVKTCKYNPVGQLISVSFDVSPDESFVFGMDKKLIGHWKGGQGKEYKYNVKMKRNYVKLPEQ